MIENITQLIEFLDQYEEEYHALRILTAGVKRDGLGEHASPITIKISFLKELIQVIQKIELSQAEVEVDQEKIDEIIEGSLQPLVGSIPSVESTLESANKTISQTS